jgi:glycosyltransferase involved in cell wall biosynthesis
VTTTTQTTAVDPISPPIPTRPSVGFVLEQSLGHVTHAKNLMEIVSQDDSIIAHWRLLPWETGSLGGRLPLYRSNWTVRAGLRARRAISGMRQEVPLDALFVHTQVPAVLVQDWLRRIPTIVSVDATPHQYDELGAFYQHERGPAVVEHLKWQVNRACFRHAEHLVSWSQWAKEGLVAAYDVPPDKVTVLAPGVDVAAWSRPRPHGPADGVIRILFVGGDLRRKGGHLLLESFRRLRERLLPTTRAELHLVTGDDVPDERGVIIHRGLQPNSLGLKALYRQADVFCLPSRGDCLPMVLSEAGAAGLPLVSTDVGAIKEIVRDGETGLLVPPDDPAALERVLARLVEDQPLRHRLGDGARQLVSEDFNAKTNTLRLVELLRDVATRSGDVGRTRQAGESS